MNQRKKALIIFAITVGFLTFVTVFGIVVTDGARVTDFSKKNMAPCLPYLFGTDWLGRDMLLRTFAGLSMSIRIGLLAAGFSAIIAFVLGVSAAVFGGKAPGEALGQHIHHRIGQQRVVLAGLLLLDRRHGGADLHPGLSAQGGRTNPSFGPSRGHRPGLLQTGAQDRHVLPDPLHHLHHLHRSGDHRPAHRRHALV